MRFVLTLLLAFVPVIGGLYQPEPDRPGDVFEYIRTLEPGYRDRAETERRAAMLAGDDGDAERWAVTLALLLEISRGASEAPSKAYALDAALDELVRARAWGLISCLSADRRRSLHAALAGFEADDPAGLRQYTRLLAQRRLDILTGEVLGADDPSFELDGLLEAHGWRAPGADGPRGRQRAKDRADYRAIDRHDVHELDGMARRHTLLPPTEALDGVPIEELDRKWQRARNLTAHVHRLWSHQDGPRIHDFLLDLALRDGTGVVRLVHADTQLMAQTDRMRRWRLREAMWRLEP